MRERRVQVDAKKGGATLYHYFFLFLLGLNFEEKTADFVVSNLMSMAQIMSRIMIARCHQL